MVLSVLADVSDWTAEDAPEALSNGLISRGDEGEFKVRVAMSTARDSEPVVRIDLSSPSASEVCIFDPTHSRFLFRGFACAS